MTDLATATGPVLHVRYDGRSFDIDMSELDIGTLSSDAQIRTAVAGHLGIPPVKLQVFDIDRNEVTGSMTLRPQAQFA